MIVIIGRVFVALLFKIEGMKELTALLVLIALFLCIDVILT
jgi:hypothetical protein